MSDIKLEKIEVESAKDTLNDDTGDVKGVQNGHNDESTRTDQENDREDNAESEQTVATKVKDGISNVVQDVVDISEQVATINDDSKLDQSIDANETAQVDGAVGETTDTFISPSDDISIASTDAIVDSTNGLPPTEEEINPDLSQLMRAAQEGNLTKVKQLTSTTCGVNDTFSDGITALHWACLNNRLTVVKYLCENGADSNAIGGDLKASPLHWAARNGLVYIVDHLISHSGADPKLRDSQSYNTLHLAVHSSNIMLVIYVLLKCDVYVDEPDSANRTSLHWAAYQGDLLSINALIRFGADVSKVDNTLFTPLHWGFIRGHKLVLKLLLEAGSDIFAKNDQGKDLFAVAVDMGCTKTWEKVLREDGRTAKTGYQRSVPVVDAKTGKVATFLVPYVILPICFQICSAGYMIPKLTASVLVAACALYLTNRFIVPTYIIDDKALSKSPLMLGIFSGTAFWAVLVWLHSLLPTLLFSSFAHFVANIVLLGIIVAFTWSFVKTMFINPGYVPTPTDNRVILSQVEDLIAEGKLDTDHFCVQTFVRRPVRSKYSHMNKRLIARFDHYCPWVYNDIGVRNHKLFMVFAYLLWAAIVLFTYLVLAYFERGEEASGYDSDDGEQCFLLSDELCYGLTNHHFMYNICAWCLVQFIWITILVVLQTLQISKGITTWEFSELTKSMRHMNHSTLPTDFGVQEVRARPHVSGLASFAKLIGVDQLVNTVGLGFAKLTDVRIPTDCGVKQNWLDFWVLGEVRWRNVFYLPIEGENNFNGKLVDYYKLWEYPEGV